ncbi:unnamed protein product [Caenorhabditis sp. 36 PRJEB53466]|nr:unnamed protein product [Caenorhabditis sp. 36 PRJEB53466]
MSEQCCWKASTVLLTVAVILLLVVIGNLIFTSEKGPIELIPEPAPHYGIFTQKPICSSEKWLRNAGDLEDVAIILTHNSLNDTSRWMREIKKQRKSSQDLLIYIFANNRTFLERQELKALRKQVDGTYHIKGSNLTEVILDVLKIEKHQFLIQVDDSQQIGADFADYYFLGKQALKLDPKIECVCGGTDNEMTADEYFQPGEGNVFWVADHPDYFCRYAPMYHRSSRLLFLEEEEREDEVCIRPEVGRVANSINYVTKMTAHLGSFDPKMLTIDALEKRMQYELTTAIRKDKFSWDDLKNQDDTKVYAFDWAEFSDLEYYFDEELIIPIMQSRSFLNVIPIYVEGHKVYIVSK